MRTYLENFMNACAYPARDVEELLKVYDAIEANVAASAEWKELLRCYENDIKCDYDAMTKRAAALSGEIKAHRFTLEFLMFVCMTKQAKVYYAQRGLSEELFLDTMVDLRYKLEECREVYGICGSFVSPWFFGFFDLTRFAFGRLQFEVINFNHDYEKDGKKLTPESRVINIHIPRTGTPMSEAACDEAFALAAKFFEKEIAGTPTAFACHSWLLFPKHEEMLAETTNVRKFMKRFDIFDSGEYGSYDELWRLFDRPFKSVDALAYDSSLRRAYVDHIRAGGKTGWGHGVFFY